VYAVSESNATSNAFSAFSLGSSQTGTGSSFPFGSQGGISNSVAANASPFGVPVNSTDGQSFFPSQQTPFGSDPETVTKDNRTSAEVAESNRDRLVAFYTKNNPEKLSSVDNILQK